MQTLFLKRENALIYTPSKAEWFGMHWELKALVKSAGGMIDISGKNTLLK